MADAFAAGGIDAMLPGAGELAFGLDFVRSAGGGSLPWVAANLRCAGATPFPAARDVARDGVRVRFVGVVGSTLAPASTCVAEPPDEPLRAAIAGASGAIVVLLSGQTVEADRALVARVAGVDFVVNGQERRMLEVPEPLAGGGLLLGVGSRGKHLGVLAFDVGAAPRAWRTTGAEDKLEATAQRLRQRLEELRPRLAAAASDAERQRYSRQIGFYERELAEATGGLDRLRALGAQAGVVQNRLRDLDGGVADHPATAVLVAKAKADIAALEAVPEGASALAHGPFVGSAACAACHPAESAQWASTAHARAHASLEAAQRASDRECYGCHVTGAAHPEGPKSPGAAVGLRDVGCEACHGPGRSHAAEPQKQPMVADPDLAVCTSCHDGERDGGRFEPDDYLARVRHGAGPR